MWVEVGPSPKPWQRMEVHSSPKLSSWFQCRFSQERHYPNLTPAPPTLRALPKWVQPGDVTAAWASL